MLVRVNTEEAIIPRFDGKVDRLPVRGAVGEAMAPVTLKSLESQGMPKGIAPMPVPDSVAKRIPNLQDYYALVLERADCPEVESTMTSIGNDLVYVRRTDCTPYALEN